MKISITVMIVFMTLVCILPYLWFVVIGRNNTQKKEKQFNDAVKSENLSCNIKEQWNNNFIGLDQAQNILVFIKLMDQDLSVLKIDLKQLRGCKINRSTREYKREKKLEYELLSLDLELTMANKEQLITLNFFDTDEGFSEDLELKRAEKWLALMQPPKHHVVMPKRAA